MLPAIRASRKKRSLARGSGGVLREHNLQRHDAQELQVLRKKHQPHAAPT